MSDKIKLVNENGRIVGKDPETDETVPIEMGDAVLESVSTESLETGPFRTEYDPEEDALITTYNDE